MESGTDLFVHSADWCLRRLGGAQSWLVRSRWQVELQFINIRSIRGWLHDQLDDIPQSLSKQTPTEKRATWKRIAHRPPPQHRMQISRCRPRSPGFFFFPFAGMTCPVIRMARGTNGMLPARRQNPLMASPTNRRKRTICSNCQPGQGGTLLNLGDSERRKS